MRHTVTKAFRPGGSGSPEAVVGSELELGTAQARVFKALGWVKEVQAAPAPAPVAAPAYSAPRTYMRRDMTAEEGADGAAAKKVTGKTTRSYTRQTKAEE